MSWTWKSGFLAAAGALVAVTVFTVQVQRVAHQINEAHAEESAQRESLLIAQLVEERAQFLKANFPFESLLGSEPLRPPYVLSALMKISAEGEGVVTQLQRSERWSLGREETASLLSLLRGRDYSDGVVYFFLRQTENQENLRILTFLAEAEPSSQSWEAAPGERTLWVGLLKENPFENLLQDNFFHAALLDPLGQVLLGPEEPFSSEWAVEVPGTNLSLIHWGEQAGGLAEGAVAQFALRLSAGFLLLLGGLFYLGRRLQGNSSSEEDSEPESDMDLLAVQVSEAEAEAASEDVSEEPSESHSPPEDPPTAPNPAPQNLEFFADTLHDHTWAMMGPVQKLKAKGLLPEHHRLLLDIENQLRPLMRVSESLRTFYQKEELPLERVDLSHEIQEVSRGRRSRWESEGVTVVEDVQEGCFVMGSAYALRTALGAVLDNSLEAMKGCERKILEISLAMSGNEVRLRVADSGAGLPVNVRHEVFDPFVSWKGGGLGLGLTYFQGVMNQMGATALLDSLPGQGVQLIVTFPKALASSVAEESAPGEDKENAAPEPPAEIKEPQHKSVEESPQGHLASWPAPSSEELLEVEEPSQSEDAGLAGEEEDIWSLSTEITFEDSEDDAEEWAMVQEDLRPTLPPQPIRVRAPRRNIEA